MSTRRRCISRLRTGDIWRDMVRVALGQIESKNKVVRLTFAALCCVSRAGMAVLETFGASCEELASKEEVERLRRVVG